MNNTHPCVAVIGGGPAGLMAAEVLSNAGVLVDLFDAMPSVGRKFLMAGKGGMNLTHAEPFEKFTSRYGNRQSQLTPILQTFGPEQLRQWCAELDIETFVGSSNRVFPKDMKAAPLLRAWLHRLRERGVRFHMRHRWTGWHPDGRLTFSSPEGERLVTADATLLALGGGSWPQLGSDGAWLAPLTEKNIPVAPLKPANCGFDCAWSEHLRARFAGLPLQTVSLSFTDADGNTHHRRGECIITEYGIEGSLIYALSAPLRDTISANGHVTLFIDLLPDRDLQHVTTEVSHPRGSRSLSTHLQSRLNLRGVKAALLRECTSKEIFSDPAQLAKSIKALPLHLTGTRPLAEAISSAGGVRFEALDDRLMVRAHPGLFCAGEMLDWEAPTGGYLLTACFATGYAASQGVLSWLQQQ